MCDPDWKAFYTPEEAECQLKDFEFKGIGWYETETDTLLVLDSTNNEYEFWCWNNPNARIDFANRTSEIVHMPVRKYCA